MIKENKITSLSKILLISIIVILLLGGTLIYYYSTTITKIIETTTVTETKTTTTTVFLDADGDGIPNYKEKEYGTDPNKPNYLLAYALKKLPENEALKFKIVENFNESSKGLVDYYGSLPENIRNSKEVNALLNQILSDNIINELEKNLFYDKFVLPSLPLIFDLNWFPTREKLDKIYDINVTFIAKDDNTPIAYAELRFVPIEYHYMIEKYGMRPEDYSKVFPPDKERVYVLTPIDGKFDSLEERFAITIADIVGGREYKIVALIRDLAGNERKTEIKTPYIRQFENLGRELYERGIIISAAYMPWNFKDIRMEVDKPLLGRYDASDDIVQWKHVDWATGHGINAFFIDGGFWEKWKLEGKEGAIINGFMNKGIKCAIMWGWVWEKYFKRGSNDAKLALWVVDLNDNYNLEIFKNLMKSLLDSKIFLHPNYLRIEGRPVLFIYDEIALINERNAYLYLLDELKKQLIKHLS
jgi:hypothetical protein